MSADTPYPSRRSLREQGLTTGSLQTLTEIGSIPAQPDSPPLTRRERRERERQGNTGALPVVTPEVAPVVRHETSGDEIDVVLPSRPVRRDTPPEAPTVVASPLSTRPLSRRERREMEKRGEQIPLTGQGPIVSEVAPSTESSPARPTEAPRPRVPTPVVEDPPPAATPPEPITPDVSRTDAGALPPVFAPPTTTDTHTAASRQVSVPSDQTNALILPVAPAMDLTGPIGDTGEVLVTGNVPLPKQVSEQAITGIVEVDDHSEFDVADTGTFSSPIRASQAVTSRSLEIAQPMIKKPRWGAGSIAMAFSAAILAVAAVGLLALALLTDLIVLPLP